MDALDLTQRIKLSVMFNLETFIFTQYGVYKALVWYVKLEVVRHWKIYLASTTYQFIYHIK